MANNCFVSLFSGAGGLDLGWRRLGGEDYAADIDPAAVETLKAKQGRAISSSRFMREAVIELADVRTLTGQKILNRVGMQRGSIPLLVGGPPCQS